MSNNQSLKQSPAEHLKPFWFKPGQSGNPNGRPKHKTPVEYAKDELQAIDPKTGKPKAQVIGINLVSDAIEGKADARKMLLEYTDGKPTQVYQIENRELRITGTLDDLTKLRQLVLEKQDYIDISQEHMEDSNDNKGIEGDV